MSKGSFVTVRCDRCGEPIRKGDEFVVFGKYPGITRSWLQAHWTGVGTLPEDFGEIYHPACYLESLEKQKETKNEGAKP